jgi:hypothetical protein
MIIEPTLRSVNLALRARECVSPSSRFAASPTSCCPAIDQAKEALQTAIAVARRQSARIFGLSTALSLAKLYRSVGRPRLRPHQPRACARSFSPTPEMPEIAEAQELRESWA